ncbi:PP2C family protein-serine/threonine phosphatase [Paenibacillus montanisoli]|uniref:Fused response regulator/phosphatase n=1 Tax=Paenibacillus montanisoli TaxID=2081970 RepID=A0A328U0J8_9BACL|nr:fused response regulator/phosphatase [Paenibacillus montanisoli]RAP74971.1 fused response regulator/phosphatase [Paenibacillus montanisoli]
MRIAVVDDNPMNITVVKEILKRAGYTDILQASSGMELFGLLGLKANGQERENGPGDDSHGIDLILLDMMMPGVDGITACSMINRSPRLKDIPIIMVTAIGDSKKLAEALDAGAIDYVTKPINRIELLARIRVALRLKEQKDWHKERDRRMREELQLAREVQLAALPQPVDDERIAIDAIFRPSEELSGDLYAWHRIDDNRYGIAVIDAMGHGISSSLACMFIASVLKEAMTKQVGVRRVMKELNRRSMQLQFADQLVQYYFTGLYMVVDLSAGTLEYVNAGHPPGMLIRSDGTIEQFAQGGIAIGMFSEMAVEKHTLAVSPGDRIVLLTDGIYDLVGSDYEEDRGTSLTALLKPFGMHASLHELEQALFSRDPEELQSDDRCLVVVDLK